MITDPKTTLTRYLDFTREAIISKVEGLPEREARLPRTPTGTNLVGIAKHCLNMEAIYFGSTFGRPFPDQDALVSEATWESDPQADWYATEDETVAGIIDLYRRVIAHSNATIAALDLDGLGHVAHWDGAEVTLHQILVHTLVDATQHAGHADILREAADGAIGWHGTGDNIPKVEWGTYVAKLTAIAERF